MDIFENYLFGNSASHERFRATTEVLANFVSHAPGAIGMAQLESATGRPAEEIAELCASLERAGLVQPDCEAAGQWILVCDASIISLEDVFRCVLNEQHDSHISSPKVSPSRTHHDVELLLMQAMITINQSMCEQLRQFSFDRLKARSTGMFPASCRRFGNDTLDNDFHLPASD